MARKKPKNIKFDWKSSFFHMTPSKALVFSLLLMSLTVFSLKTTYTSLGDWLIITSALLNTILIMLCYVFACSIVALFEKVKKR